MLDILFISYDEPNADENYSALLARFPHARRVHGVKGIANAHIKAAKKAMTTFFYVVDGDAEILPTFNFEFKPGPGDENYVHIWNAKNPVGLVYGYGGVKLFSKKFFVNIKSQLDFTTTLTSGIKIHDDVACITRFNSDPLHAYRGAYREAVKLWKTINNPDLPMHIRIEADQRRQIWSSPDLTCSFRDDIVRGVVDGIKAAHDKTEHLYINDFDYFKNDS